MEKQYYIYAIVSQSSGKIYIGQTNNIDQRIKRHNNILPRKNTNYTFKNTGPWNLFYKESFKTRSEALVREKELKSYRGREFLKNMLNRE